MACFFGFGRLRLLQCHGELVRKRALDLRNHRVRLDERGSAREEAQPVDGRRQDLLGRLHDSSGVRRDHRILKTRATTINKKDARK